MSAPTRSDPRGVTAAVWGAATTSWRLSPGPGNTISDVEGVRFGHATLYDPSRGHCTGVTAVIPADDVVTSPLTAAVHVINGYGKSVGLMQIEEIGELESPIALTGVFNVPAVHQALQQWLMRTDPTIGAEGSGRSVNAVVLECNDSHMHDPRTVVPTEEDLAAAFADARSGTSAIGAIGAGTGMATFGYAGAIGTASRRLGADARDGTIGVLVLSNFGSPSDLVIAGVPVNGPEMPPEPTRESDGSVIVLVATDLPLGQAQLKRLARRAQSGLARTGCPTGGTSGELVLAFTTSRELPARPVRWQRQLDMAFRGVAESVEEAVLSGILAAGDVAGRGGRTLPGFPTDRLPALLGVRPVA